MIIVSQNKNMTTECLELKIIDRGAKRFAIYSYGLSEDIGIYKTEERAKEVLQEIVNYASISEIHNSYEVADLRLKLAKMCRYEMPEE